jgi:opacity protein-like surface antigen
MMAKRLFLYISAFLIITSGPLRAQDFFGLGLHVGYHHNVGEFSSYNPSFQMVPQNNMLVGLAIKASYRFIFLRTGCETSFMLHMGEVQENTDTNDTIETTRLRYTTIPGYIGLDFPIQDIGEFYMGCGVAWFLGNGTITVNGSQKDLNAQAFGFGFITGIQLNLVYSLRLYVEWEYLEARSKPTMNTQTAPQAWKNYSIDFTGHRFLLGIMYYVI